MKRFFWSCVLTLLFFYGVGITPIAESIPVFFTDRTAFDTASGGGLNFESFEANFAVASSIAFTDFTVSETIGANALGQVRNYPIAGLNAVITDGTGAIFYDDNGSSIGTFFSFTSPVNAFGIDIATNNGSTVTIGGSVSTSISLSAGVPKFFGVIDTTGTFSSITFNASGGPNVGFDSASTGMAAPISEPIPEPTTMFLMGFGILGLVGFGIRQRRKK